MCARSVKKKKIALDMEIERCNDSIAKQAQQRTGRHTEENSKQRTSEEEVWRKKCGQKIGKTRQRSVKASDLWSVLHCE